MKRLRIVLPLALLPLGCMTSTEAEDPLPGPIQEAAVFAMDDPELAVLHATVLLPVPPRAAVRWFREPDLLEGWLAEQVTLAAEVGGAVVLAWPTWGATLEGSVVDEGIDFLELLLAPYGGIAETHVRLTAQPEGDFTRLAVEQWPFPATREGDEMAERYRAAWFRALAVLRATILRGELPTVPPPPP